MSGKTVSCKSGNSCLEDESSGSFKPECKKAPVVPLELPPFSPIGEVLVLGYDVCYKRWIDLENKSNCGVVLNVAPDDGQLNNWLAQSSILHVFPVSDARPDCFVNKKL